MTSREDWAALFHRFAMGSKRERAARPIGDALTPKPTAEKTTSSNPKYILHPPLHFAFLSLPLIIN